MAQNPYQAPESQVADPVTQQGPPPPEVSLACRILWISLGASLVTMLPAIRGEWWAPQGTEDFAGIAAVTIGFALAMIALYAWLVWMVSQGRNWARWALLACFVLGWFVWLSDMPRSIAETPLAALADTLIALAEVWACYLLFRGPGAAWFTRAN